MQLREARRGWRKEGRKADLKRKRGSKRGRQWQAGEKQRIKGREREANNVQLTNEPDTISSEPRRAL